MRLRIVLLAVIGLLVVGCSTPASVIIAAKAEQDLLASYRAGVSAAMDILAEDLDVAINDHIETILDYEVRLQAEGLTIAVDKLQALLEQYRGKRAAIKARLALIREQIRSADLTIEQAQAIHKSMIHYLAREQVSLKDLQNVWDEIKGTKGGVE